MTTDADIIACYRRLTNVHAVARELSLGVTRVNIVVRDAGLIHLGKQASADKRRGRRIQALHQPRRVPLELADTTWAYVAGIFDGEGSISRQDTRWYISIAQLTETGLCAWLARTMQCGGITTRTKEGMRSMDAWKVARLNDVIALIEGMLPYLIVKREGCLQALAELKSPEISLDNLAEAV